MEAFEQIDIHKAKELIDATAVTVIDIRDPESYKQAHIPNAIPVNASERARFFVLRIP